MTSEPFYAFQFYVPSDKASAPLKFGGLVWNEANQPVASYWEDAALTDIKSGTRTDKVFDRSVALPSGNYRGAFGLFPASGGAAVATASSTFRLESKPGEFGVSPLILANTLTPLTKRPGPTDPFVFGVEKPIKVEPKGDRQFAKEDSLWYFYAINDPTVAAATPAGPRDSGRRGGSRGRRTEAANHDPHHGDEGRQGSVPADDEPGGASTARPELLRERQRDSPGELRTGLLHVHDSRPRLKRPEDSAAFKGIERKEDFVVLSADGSLPPKPAAKPAPKPKVAKKP